MASMQLLGRRSSPYSRWQLYDNVLFKDVVLVVFCHWSDESNCVPFVEPITREASAVFVGSSNNDVSIVLVALSDDIGGSYTSCVVAKDLWRRANMAIMSTSMLGATEKWPQASRIFDGTFNSGEIRGSICGESRTRRFAYREAEIYLVDICLTAA